MQWPGVEPGSHAESLMEGKNDSRYTTIALLNNLHILNYNP